MGPLILALIAASSFTCAAMGGRVAHLKRRRLAEGVGLGLVLGPLGLLIEGRMPAKTVTALEKRGHLVQVGELWSEGRLSAAAVERTPDGTVLKAGANPRGMQGYAIAR